MNDRQTRTSEAYQRILASYAGKQLPAETDLVVQRLRSTVALIEECGMDQFQARHNLGVTIARSELEIMRRDQMLPLARLCRRAFAGETAVLAAVRVPHKRAPTDTLLAAAVRMGKTLRPLRKGLTACGMDPRRVEDLQKETRRLQALFKSAYGSIADRAVPTRRLRELFASALLDVDILDAFRGVGGPRDDRALWKRERKIGKRMGRPKASRRQKAESTHVA